VVLAGNIGRFSRMFRQPREVSPCKNEASRDDDLDEFGRGNHASVLWGPESDLCPEPAKYKVTIFGKLSDPGGEGGFC
jgi:hypothetical protein